jgi:erythronate-4-phosphate dehydrogenase
LLLEGTSVKFIATATIGHDHIDSTFCDKEGIWWTNTPGCNASSVMQYMASALVCLSRGKNISLQGKTLGIVGAGHVGKKVEMLAGILGLNVLINDPPRARSEEGGYFVGLHELLEQSDIVTLHVPLTFDGADKTFHLLDPLSINLLKPAAWLINTSRGEVVDSEALKCALNKKKLAGAILDVWEYEPDIDRELLGKVFIGTPHIAGYSVDGKANGTAMVVRSLSSFFGLPLTSWYPEELPVPLNDSMINARNIQSDDEFPGNAILHTYDINYDSNKLKTNPLDFEKLRNNYPVRREYPAYFIESSSIPIEEIEKLAALGFNIIA